MVELCVESPHFLTLFVRMMVKKSFGVIIYQAVPQILWYKNVSDLETITGITKLPYSD